MFLKICFSAFCKSGVMYITPKFASAKFNIDVVTKLLFELISAVA
jgi:hypothetical protein